MVLTQQFQLADSIALAQMLIHGTGLVVFPRPVLSTYSRMPLMMILRFRGLILPLKEVLTMLLLSLLLTLKPLWATTRSASITAAQPMLALLGDQYYNSMTPVVSTTNTTVGQRFPKARSLLTFISFMVIKQVQLVIHHYFSIMNMVKH